jgi:hypothetical protein
MDALQKYLLKALPSLPIYASIGPTEKSGQPDELGRRVPIASTGNEAAELAGFAEYS